MSIEKILGVKIPPPPIGLDEDLETHWGIPYWRALFKKERSQIKGTLLVDWVRINIPAVLIAILLGRLLYLNTTVSISDGSLSALAIGIMTASAAILTIITAFLTFWFGSAINSLKRMRNMISDELSHLADIKEDIEPSTKGPKENVMGNIREKVLDLAKKSKNFLNTLKVLSGRFHRATIGTYCDSNELFKLEAAITDTGGKWFVAYRKAFEGHEAHDFCRKIWLKAMETSRRLDNLNNEIIQANGQLKDIVKFMPTLASVLLIFIFALVVTFLSNITYSTTSSSTLLPVTKLIFGSLLIILLPVQLVKLVQYLWSLVSSKYIAYKTNSIIALRENSYLERHYQIDYKRAIMREAETLLEASRGRQEGE